MSEKNYHLQVSKNYEEINNKWLQLHFRLLAICAVLSTIIEIVMYYYLKADGFIFDYKLYWAKYILFPVGVIILITVIGYIIIKNKKLTKTAKQYGISFTFGMFAFVLTLVHSGFVSVLICAIFPILMTIMYENQKLTLVTGIFCVVQQILNGFIIFWDPKKVLSTGYILDAVVIITITIAVWYACHTMIKFTIMKRNIIINNDVERIQLKERINIDELTSVGNKQAMVKFLETTSFTSNHIYYIVMLDIDKFKVINDTYGHLFGDEVLKCIGESMLKIETPSNAFRYGGDEFCILFSEPSIDEVIKEIKRLQQYLIENMKRANSEVDILVSAGISAYSYTKTWTDLLKQADKALYEAKRQEGGKIVVYQPQD